MTRHEDFVPFVVPWSGEIIPVPEPPVDAGPLPPFPPSLPSPGPIINFIGQGEHAVWNDVWNWIKGGASAAVSTLEQVEATVAPAIVGTIENYVGNHLAAISGFVNGAYQYALDVAADVSRVTFDNFLTLYNDVAFIDQVLAQLLNDVQGIDNFVANLVGGAIDALRTELDNLIGGAVAGVETWAIDNIYNPLDDRITSVETTIDDAIVGAVADVEAYARDLVNQETLQRLAAIAGIIAAVGAITTFVEECGQPMCDTMGPNTDLGKLLKALDALGLLAVLAELANSRFTDWEDFIRTIVDKAAAMVDTFDTYFIEDGEKLGDTIARIFV